MEQERTKKGGEKNEKEQANNRAASFLVKNTHTQIHHTVFAHRHENKQKLTKIIYNMLLIGPTIQNTFTLYCIHKIKTPCVL